MTTKTTTTSSNNDTTKRPTTPRGRCDRQVCLLARMRLCRLATAHLLTRGTAATPALALSTQQPAAGPSTMGRGCRRQQSRGIWFYHLLQRRARRQLEHDEHHGRDEEADDVDGGCNHLHLGQRVELTDCKRLIMPQKPSMSTK